MLVHDGADNLNLVRPVVTMGIFDGVHRGHLLLLNRLVSYARNENGESVVVTFDPHPRIVLPRQQGVLQVLTTLLEKKALLEKQGIDHLIILRFNRELSNIDACSFIEKILVKEIGIRRLIVGYDHHFGNKREGNIETIRKCAARFDFEVDQVTEVCNDGITVSSTAIRDLLLAGKLEEGNGLLGYYYSLTGTIIEGRKIGREIGFPTANISVTDKYKLIPADGVYAVEVKLDKDVFPGMLSIGSNPTINSGKGGRSVEVNIFNFEGNIYGRELTIIFRFRMRDEIKFDTLGKLVEQMKLDKQQAMRLLT